MTRSTAAGTAARSAGLSWSVNVRISPIWAPITMTSGRSPESARESFEKAGQAQLVKTELGAGRLEVAGREAVQASQGRPHPDSVDHHRLGAVLDAREGVQAGDADVEQFDAMGKRTELPQM